MTPIALDLVPPFLAVAELGSFSAAAARLRVEKSSVSRAIGRLEDAVGERLFLRTTRSVALTNAGQMMRDRLRGPYDGLDAAMKQVLDTARSPSGTITVTMPADFGALILSEAITRVLRHHPNIRFDVRISSRHLDLVSEKIDCAVRLTLGRLKDSTMKARRLGDLVIGLFASRAYAETRGLPRGLEEIKLHPVVSVRQVPHFRMEGPGGTVRVSLDGHVVCDDMFVIHETVLRGAGIGVIPWFVAERDIREGRLVPVLPRWTMHDVAAWWITPAGAKPSRAVDALRDHVIDVMASRPSGFRLAPS